MHTSSWFSLSRAVFALVGAGALLMSLGGLTSGASLSDPVFPAGIALGAFGLGAAAWADAPERWRAAVTWVGVAAVLVGLGVFAWFVFGDPDIGADVYPYFLVPAAVLLAATVGVARGRVRAGALGLEASRSTAR
ncbi:MAG TPA: hypothetical protein VFM03_03585 [Candidatus Limnocylindria bacterium]|nr:hypothetical protein [Candidatus Limnocylindria bacterium]